VFTGIVEALGEVVRLDRHGDGGVLHLRCPPVAAGSAPGDSVAVNGVCLTVVETGPDGFSVDVMRETFDRSTIGSLTSGDPVNLERAATVSTRLGGHIVQGHVDGVGPVLSRTRGDGWEDVTVALPPALSRYVVEKGSIAVDGVSLTVVGVADEPAAFTVSLVPTTTQRTTLGRRAAGELVNLEVDVIAKYVEKLVAGVRP
jgi:riboflavin synthase